MKNVVNRLAFIEDLHPVEAYQIFDYYNDRPEDKFGCPTCKTDGICATREAAIEARAHQITDEFPLGYAPYLAAQEASEDDILKRLEDIEIALSASPGLRDQDNALSRIRGRVSQARSVKFKKADRGL